MNPWINATVLENKKWNNNLFTIILNADIFPFKAGQFTKISMIQENNQRIQRAYSFVNSPNNKKIEIFIIRVKNGKLSNLLYNLKVGDNIFIKKYASGFFTLDEIPSCETLWMFSTGTAIGPYCSILQENNKTDKFKNIVLVHALKNYDELVYLSLIKKMIKKYNGKLKFQIITSREKNKNSLFGRIPFLLQNKTLENEIGLTIDKKNCHIMLCGNPNMVKDTYFYLTKNKLMKKHLRRVPGQITMENYW